MASSDLVVENYRPGDLARWGLDYEDLSALRPRLFWCAISGFGREGADADRLGYDFLVRAMGGIMSLTGAPDGPPMNVGIADVMCGLYAATGILAALRHRDREGGSQWVDISLYDTHLAWLINAATNTLVTGQATRRLGNRHPNVAPFQTYATAAATLALAVGNDSQFARLAQVLAYPEMLAGGMITPIAAGEGLPATQLLAILCVCQKRRCAHPRDRLCWIRTAPRFCVLGVECGNSHPCLLR